MVEKNGHSWGVIPATVSSRTMGNELLQKCTNVLVFCGCHDATYAHTSLIAL